jgi:hypothetical protein
MESSKNQKKSGEDIDVELFVSKTVQQKQFEPLTVSLKLTKRIDLTSEDFEEELRDLRESLVDELAEIYEEGRIKFKDI